MKKILGLDLGTNSIGWALVNESETESEEPSIIKTGVRVIPLTTDESTDFEKGKSVSINAERTLKRSARRNLQRYKQRRKYLINILKQNNILNDSSILSETGKDSTYTIWKLRNRAAVEQISLEDFARVLLALNKKRGYKSNRKTKDEEDGQIIDGMEIAKLLYKEKITPGQMVYKRLQEGKMNIPEFYRSDLQDEFDEIWEKQKEYYPDILTGELKGNLEGKNKGQTWKICEQPFEIVGVKRQGKAAEQKIENYKWRSKGVEGKLELEKLAIVLQEINGQIYNSSGYLAAISDRSKELYFNNLTVGQYLYNQVRSNPHTPLKNQVFYRQDYLDEFNRIWEVQSKERKQILTDELKEEIRDAIIFYQRRLKSQKDLISICELEGREKEIEKDGKKKKEIIGPRVIPRSSPLFQEFKIWQNLNNLKFTNTETRETFHISELDEDVEIRTQMFNELNIKGKLSTREVLKASIKDYEKWEAKNFKDIEGNQTNAVLFKAYNQIAELSGHTKGSQESFSYIREVFQTLGINTNILTFNSELEKKELEKQPSYQLWHLLYSYEGDNSKSGNEKLLKQLNLKFGFEKEFGKVLANITFQDAYGSLSAKAIKKILPYLRSGHEYSEACSLAGYNHSHSLTREENENRILQNHLELLPKNSLRNPVVEKILNQMINVINAIIEKYGKPDEIRIELARELKKSAAERAEMTSNISKATIAHIAIKKKLSELHPFKSGVRITKNDIIKFKLWEELAPLGYKTLYTNTYIPIEKLFTKEFDIEHIIPKAVLFDDSFSNKTLAVRDFNRVKSDKTGIDAVIEKYGEGSEEYNRYVNNIGRLLNDKKISKAKYNKLLMKAGDIPDGFIERDLRNSQYIAKKAQEMLKKVVKTVVSTTGSVTDKLREDWQLINIMQELNWEKYDKLGLTAYEINKDGQKIPVIKDWTKRNDHRHHAMDALTVAFTKHNHIQYFNYLNARSDESHKKHSNIIAIEQKETYINDKNKRIVKPPIPIEKFRDEARKHLENTLVSFKAKNKVVTRNINKTKNKDGEIRKVELTPRGQLHEDTVYGQINWSRILLSDKISKREIEAIRDKKLKTLIKKYIEEKGSIKKAFSKENLKNLKYKNEILSELTINIPCYTKRINVSNFFTDPQKTESAKKKAIDNMLDLKTRKLFNSRLQSFNWDFKKAFSNLEENPIWLNREKGIKLKRVTITGVSNAEALHTKKDHFGNEILDENGNPFPADFVSTGNNHHVAIYRDEKGNLQENVVSFFEAVARVNEGISVIQHIHPKHPDWEFLFTMKQNEYFVFPNTETGFNPTEIDLMNESNYHLISPNLFRVQKIATKDYFFRHHLETNVETKASLKGILWKREGLSGIESIVKVRINHIGQIVKLGE